MRVDMGNLFYFIYHHKYEHRDREFIYDGTFYSFIFYLLLFGPFLEVLQYQANPWGKRSKPLPFPLMSKISLISKPPNRERIRY